MASPIETKVLITVDTDGEGKLGALSREVAELGKGAGAATPEFKQLADELDALAKQQALIDQFVSLKRAAVEYGDALAKVQAQTAESARAMRGTGEGAEAAKQAFARNREEAQRLKVAFEGNRLALHQTRQAMQAAGIASTGLAGAQVRLSTSAQQVATRVGDLRTRLQGVGAAAQAAGQQTAAGFTKAAQGVRSISDQLAGIQTRLIQFGAAQIGTQMAGDLARTADLYANVGARLDLVNGSQQGFNVSLEQTAELARSTHSGLESTTSLVAALARAGESVGLSQEGVLRLTETINKANQVSGASAASADAALTQLIQGLQAGTLRGDEFNSVMEQSPRLAKALADGLGVPIGALRKMAEEGKLSSEVVIGALQSQAQTIDKEFTRLPLTIGRAMTDLSTNWTQFIGEMDRASGASAAVARAIEGVAGNLDTIAQLATLAGEAALAAFAVKMLPQVRAFAGEVLTATRQVGGLRSGLAALPTSLKIGIAVVGVEMLPELGRLIGETAAKWSGAGEMMRQAEERMRESSSSMLASGQNLAIANEQYRKTVALSAEDVARLSDAERTAYRQRLTGAQQYFSGAMRAAAAAKELGITSEFAADQAAEGLKRAREGLVEFERGASMSRAEVENLLSVDASLLIAQFDELAAKGKNTAAALQELGKGFDAGSLASVRGFGQALTELQATGKASADEVGQAWQMALSKLDGAQLNQFMITAQAAFGQSARDVDALTAAMDVALRASIAATGQDFSLLSAGISAGAASALGHLDVLVAGFDALKASGADTSAALAGAVDFAVQAADSTTAVAALRQRVEELGRNGLLSGAQVAAALQKIADKSDQVTAGVNSVAEALRALGITSDAELKKTADGFREAYQAVVDMGGSVREQEAAFRKYAAAAIAANGGVVDSMLKSQAAMHGLLIEVDEAGNAIFRTFADKIRGGIDSAKDAAAEFGQRIDELGEKAEKLADGVERIGTGFRNAAKQSVDAGGNVITAFGGYTERGAFDRAKSAGLDDAAALGLAEQYFNTRNQADALSRFNAAIDEAVLAAARARVAAESASAAPRTTAPSMSQQAAVVHRVDVSIGGRTGSVMTDAAGANTLTNLLRELEKDAARA